MKVKCLIILYQAIVIVLVHNSYTGGQVPVCDRSASYKNKRYRRHIWLISFHNNISDLCDDAGVYFRLLRCR